MGILRREIKNPGRVYFWCPGCNDLHLVAVPPAPNAWGFNGDSTKPTFTPSVLVTAYKGRDVESICHSFVTDGIINFLDDSTAHTLRGLHHIPAIPAEREMNPEWFESF